MLTSPSPLSRRRRSTRDSRPRPIEALEPRILFATNPIFPFKAAVFASFTGKGVGLTGIQPYGLTRDSAGDLFGTTAQGGKFGFGTIFKIPAGTNTIVTLANFSNNIKSTTLDNSTLSGWYPMGNLVLDEGAGLLYGTTLHGGSTGDGTVFRFNITDTTGTITTIHSFQGGTDGANPFAGVSIFNGTLFGTTYGTNGSFIDHPTVFKINNPAATDASITTLSSLSIYNHITGSVFVNAAGDIFGATVTGGTSNFGTFFEVSHGTTIATTLVNFNGTNGRAPSGTFVDDGHGHVVSYTANGGPNNTGLLYSFDPSAFAGITTIATFNGTNGNRPIGLTATAGGTIYGVTSAGGAYNAGTVFRINNLQNNTASITTLYSYINWQNGWYPTGPLVVEGEGNRIFALTYAGGASNFGSVNLVYDSTLPTVNDPVQIVWKTQPPASTTAGIAIATPAKPLVLNLLDVGKNLATSSTNTITLSIKSGPAGATLLGTTSVPAVGGIVTFSDLTLNIAGTYTLIATDTTNTDRISAPSKSFKIIPAAATQLVVDDAQVPFGQIFTVKIEDPFGNVATSASPRVYLILPPLSGTSNVQTNVVARAGVASFTMNNKLVPAPGSYAFNATSGTLTPAAGTLLVDPAVTTISTPARNARYHANQTINLTSTLSSLAPVSASTSFSGTLSIINNANNTDILTSSTISTTTAKMVIAGNTLTPGTYTVYVKYGGDVWHSNATSSAFSLVIIA